MMLKLFAKNVKVFEKKFCIVKSKDNNSKILTFSIWGTHANVHM